MDPRKPFEKLIEIAIHRGGLISSCPDGRVVERCREQGTPLPEKVKPGALLNELNAEEREAIQALTSDMTLKYRI